MKRILLAFLFALPLAAANTAIVDTIRYLNGSLATCTFNIRGPISSAGVETTATAGDGSSINPSTYTYNVVQGVLNVSIHPNDDLTPSATTYRVTSSCKPPGPSSATEYWSVPTSPTPLTVANVLVSTTSSPSILFGQIRGLTGGCFLYGLTTGMAGCLTKPADGTYSVQFTSGVPSWTAGGGGGGAVSSVFTRTGAVTAQSGDYTTAQVTESGNLYYTSARVRAAISAALPMSFNSSTGEFSISLAGPSHDGYLSSIDWNTFNSRAASIGEATTVQVSDGIGGFVDSGCTAATGAIVCAAGVSTSELLGTSAFAWSLITGPLTTDVAASRPACSAAGYYLASDTHALTRCDGAAWSSTLNPSGAIACIVDSVAGSFQCYDSLGTATIIPATRAVNGHALSADVTVSKSDVGLANADNTSDANKPISTATQTALNAKAPSTNIALSALATQADQTIVGNVSGGAAAPIALTKAQALTFLGGSGVLNVRIKYGAVPDGSTDNSTAIASAFTASNAFTVGVPTVYFDCDTSTTVCQYNYGGSGISPINPLRATTIMCAPGATLNYTGSAHAGDFGPTNLTKADEQIYTVFGCRWTGGASMTAGLYFNSYVANPQIILNHFYNFGNQSGYALVFPGNNWMPGVALNRWTDTDGFSKNMVDAHTGTNVGLDFALNKSECTTSGGTACSVSTVGVGLWLASGRVTNNEIKFHAPLIRISSCQTCGGGQSLYIAHNLLEGNTGQTGPGVTFGDPGTAGVHVGGNPTSFLNNYVYWPGASTIPAIGAESASSGSFALDNLTLTGNNFTFAPTGGAVYVNTNQGSQGYVANNRNGNTILNQASSPAIIDAGFATQQTRFGLQSFQNSGGALANSIAMYDSNGVNAIRATYHGMAGAMLCSDTTGSGTVQTCTTAPSSDIGGTSLTPAAGDAIIYKTTTANTGDLTINVNSTGAVHVKKWQGTSTLAAGDLKANVPVILSFDGTFWELVTIGTAASTAVQKGTGSGGLTPAAAADIVSLFSACSGTQYLGADGSCHAGGGATIASTTSPLKGDNAGNAVAALAADVVALFSTCSGTQYLGADGACHTSSGNSSAGTNLQIQHTDGSGGFAAGTIKNSGGVLFPTSDGTTAIQQTKADGTTILTNLDTTNANFGFQIPANTTGRRAYVFAGNSGAVFKLQRWANDFGSATTTIWSVDNAIGNDMFHSTGAFGVGAALVAEGGVTSSITGCGTAGSITGGKIAGTFTAGATSCTPVITLPTSLTGWICHLVDRTTATGANLMNISSTTTSATFPTFTAVSSDVIAWSCMGY